MTQTQILSNLLSFWYRYCMERYLNRTIWGHLSSWQTLCSPLTYPSKPVTLTTCQKPRAGEWYDKKYFKRKNKRETTEEIKINKESGNWRTSFIGREVISDHASIVFFTKKREKTEEQTILSTIGVFEILMNWPSNPQIIISWSSIFVYHQSLFVVFAYFCFCFFLFFKSWTSI